MRHLRPASAMAELTREARQVAHDIHIDALSGYGVGVRHLSDPLVEWLRSAGYTVEPDPHSVKGCYRITWLADES